MARASDPSKAIPMIAIVDDDDAVREATAGFVRSLGYSASTFASADEFLESEQVGKHIVSHHGCADAGHERL
jgi:FixJ family two-component response regulator